jgi:hypothetical protein
MDKAIEDFRENMLRVRTIGGLYHALQRLTTPAIDASDLLRIQIVLGGSALDHYVHELTRLGMLDVLSGARPPTPAFLKFRVSMDTVLGSSSDPTGYVWLDSEIRERHSFVSFQHPDKIADAIRLFADVQLWKEVGQKLAMPDSEIKERLRQIVDRRNKIAHEADMDPTFPGARWPISQSDVDTALDTIESVCEAVHIIVV